MCYISIGILTNTNPNQRTKIMHMTLKRDWPALDGSKSIKDNAKHTVIPIGRHEVELVPNPYGLGGNWIVLKGTAIGASEASWRQWVNDGSVIDNPGHPNHGEVIDWEDLEVVIEED